MLLVHRYNKARDSLPGLHLQVKEGDPIDQDHFKKLANAASTTTQKAIDDLIGKLLIIRRKFPDGRADSVFNNAFESLRDVLRNVGYLLPE